MPGYLLTIILYAHGRKGADRQADHQSLRPAAHRQALFIARHLRRFCGDNFEQLAKPALSLSNGPDSCVELIYIDPALVSHIEPPFNSNRNYEVFWGENKQKQAFEDRHASTQAYIDYMRPRCVQRARVLKKTGSFYYHCDWLRTSNWRD